MEKEQLMNDLAFLIYRHETGIGEEEAKNNWTAKHFQDKAKNNAYPLAEKVYDFLEKKFLNEKQKKRA